MHIATALACILLASRSHASQTVSGRWIVANYGDMGVWNDHDIDAGLACDFDGDGELTEVTFVGTHYGSFAVAFRHDGEVFEHYATSLSSSTTVLSEADRSTEDLAWSAYEYDAGPLAVSKDEVWGMDERTMLVRWNLRNKSDHDVEDIRMALLVDPDQDYDAGNQRSYWTENDVDDLDGDGLEDWVQSVGPDSDDTVGFGACDQRNSEVGHYFLPDGGTSADLNGVMDYEGSRGDYAMVWRWEAPHLLEPGASFTTSLIVAIGDNEDEAQDRWLAAMEDCVVLGLDEDGEGSPFSLWSGCDGSPYDCAHSAGRPAPAGWALALGAVAALRRRAVLRRERCAAPPPWARSRPARPAAPA